MLNPKVSEFTFQKEWRVNNILPHDIVKQINQIVISIANSQDMIR